MRTLRTCVRKDEQRRMARPAGCDQVHSGVTLLVSGFVVRNVSVHKGIQRETSGQLRFLGSMGLHTRGGAKYAVRADRL